MRSAVQREHADGGHEALGARSPHDLLGLWIAGLRVVQGQDDEAAGALPAQAGEDRGGLLRRGRPVAAVVVARPRVLPGDRVDGQPVDRREAVLRDQQHVGGRRADALHQCDEPVLGLRSVLGDVEVVEVEAVEAQGLQACRRARRDPLPARGARVDVALARPARNRAEGPLRRDLGRVRPPVLDRADRQVGDHERARRARRRQPPARRRVVAGRVGQAVDDDQVGPVERGQRVGADQRGPASHAAQRGQPRAARRRWIAAVVRHASSSS